MSDSAAPLLQVEDIQTYYGKSHILRGVSLKVERGEIVALLGLNGAGKTTTIRSILGLTPPRAGSIRFKGIEVGGKATYQIAKMGIGYVPEGRLMFGALTTLETLQLAERGNGDGSWTIERTLERFPKLAELRNRKSGRLSGGEQEMLAIGRALVGNPDLLLVDEPSQGLAPIIVREVYRMMEDLRSHGVSILLVEQNAIMALKAAQRAYVIDDGRIVYDGDAAQLRADRERVRQLMGLATT
ncbi:MAG: ABC transporter ATP-binding protein [Candidatus Eremiobacteraeota bacterium]|nr:ABC transporter ATP-binding protein [Candidatus Eremiobacteraeota bacterium]